jgi:hypothetical protein
MLFQKSEFLNFFSEEKIKKRGNVQLSLAFKTLEDVSRSRGFSADDLIALTEAAASGRHGMISES